MHILNPRKLRKIINTIGMLLSVLMVFSIFTINIPSAYAEEPQTTETPQVIEEPQPTETPTVAEEPQPAETPKVAEEPQPTETPHLTDGPQPAEMPQVTDDMQTNEVGKAYGKPDKGSLSAAEKKLSTKILQLTNDEYLPSGITGGELINQMAKQNQIKQGNEASTVPGSSGTSVHVYINTKKGSKIKVLSEYAKIENTDEKSELITAWVDVSMIKSLASLDCVNSIREVIPPYVRAGSALSEGDTLLNADDVRSITGVDGTGVKVGIISDGVDHLASAVSSGDLPGGVNAVHVLSNTVGGDEGTAILEIVHDLAPGAELYFHDCGDNTIAFNAAITELAQAGCDIICDDIGWLAEPFFEDGSVAQHVADVMSTYGLLYVSSAGNAAKNHYQGLFVDLGNNDLFGDGCPTADFSGNGSDPFLYAQVPAGSQTIVIMEWNDPFGSSANDYDLEIYDTNSRDLLDGSYYLQEGSGSDPVEYIIYTNKSSSAQDITIRACKYKNPENNIMAADKILEIYTYGCYTYPTNTVAADSIFGHPAVPGVLSCGAIDGNSGDGAEFGAIEDFSSRGPVTMISGTRQKPDICGIDGVSVTGAGGFPNPFYGTSAAAPNIAAVAALLESIFPAESASNIREMILNNSVDLGSSGYDNTYGYGRADALAAVQNSSCIVTFNALSGSDIDAQRVIKGGKVNKPSNPSKTNWFFAGWYKEEECINAWDFANDTVTSDITLYAKWMDSRDVYTISEDGTYDIGDYGDISQITIDPGLTVTITNNSAATFNTKITCGEGIKLTIDNLVIKCSNESALSFIGSGNSLTLVGENSLKSGPDKPGIKVEEGTSLEISGSGSVLAVSGSNAAGIGGGNGLGGGSVTVSGGIVYAWGTGSYDIGGGEGGTGGALSISGDSAVLLANGTSAVPSTSTHELITTNSVQEDSAFGKIKLPDGWPRPVYAYLNSSAISTLTYDGNGGTGTIPEAVVQYNGTSAKLSKATGLSKNGDPVGSWNTRPDGLGTSYTLDTAFTITGDITLYAIYASFPVTEYNAFDNLGFVPMDTAMDPNRDVVYMTESGGCSLYRIDLNTGKIGYIEFPYKAERLTVKNDKIYVTLPIQAHQYSMDSEGSGYIGVVDAATFTIDKIFSVVPDPYDIEADDEGRVYIGAGSDQWSILSVYDTETEQQIDTVGLYRFQSLLDFNPVYNKLYSIDTDSSPRDLKAYEITDGNITNYYDSPYHGDYSMSTYMKISPDGQHIFNGSGNVFTSTPTKTGDMVYAGNIGMTFNSICFDQNNNELIITNNEGMFICDYDTWAVKAAQGSKDNYKGVYCNSSHFISLMGTSAGKYYIVLDNKTPGLDVKGVAITQDSVVMMDNETETLTATISPRYATNQNMIWSSSNESVAIVSNGVITAVGGGSAVITVTTQQGGFKDTCSVTVIPYKDYSAFDGLWFTPMDTAIDPDRDFMYMTETGGYRLYRIDLNTGKIDYIKFPYKAERLTVKNGKIYLTLPYGVHDPYDFTDGSGSIVIIDAATFSVDKVFDVVPDPYDVEADAGGRVYIASGSGQWTSLTVYDTDTEQQVDSVGIRQMSLLDFNAIYNKLYSIDTDSSPRDIEAYEITDGDITAVYDSPYHGDYSMSTYMKVSPDGKYIFNGSGNVFTCAPQKTGDMIYAGSLGLTFNSICFDLSNNEFIFANDNGMYICDYDTRTVKAAQGSKDLYKGVYYNGRHFVTMMKTSAGKYYLVLDNKTPGLNVTGITLTPENLVLLKDETETLTATISPKYATNQNITWSSSNENVASVSNGVITAVGAGDAVITVTTQQGEFKDTCNVTVIAYKECNAYEKLWFTPMDTAMDPDRDVMYMTETGGNKLYRIDLNTGKIEYIEFPYKAERLTVKNDKIYVTLPHGKHDYYNSSDGSGTIAIIDAATFSVDKMFDETPDPYDIEIDDAGRAYIASGSGQWTILTVYDTGTGQQIDSVEIFRQMSLLEYNPVYNKLYSITTETSPRDITAYEITDGDIITKYDSPYHGDYAMSTYMKISPDGQYIFNGSGNIFKSAPTYTGDMVYAGTLGSTYTSICFDIADNRLYTCNANTLKAYAYDTKTLVSTITSPDQFVSLQYKGKDEEITALQKNSAGVYFLKDYTMDCLLSGVSIDGVPVSGFDPLVQDCNITIPINNDTINISATALDSHGQVSGDVGAQPLDLGGNTFTIIVTGSVTGQTKTYTVHVTKIVPGNANLSSINTTAGTLTPVFGKDTLSYMLSLDENTASVTLTPAKEDSEAAIKINGSSVTSKTISVSTGSSADVIIEVTAKDKLTKKTYTVHIIRAVSTNADLSSLSTSSGTLAPAFSADTYEYSVSLTSTASYPTISATKASSAATVRINGVIRTSIAVSPLTGQSIDVVFYVTAQDGVTVKTYTVHVSRALSDNANLSGISLSTGTLSPLFNANTVEYNVMLSSLTSGTTVSAVKADSTSTMKFDGADASSEAITLDPGQSRDVTIEVTAQDGKTVKTYVVHVTRTLTNDATLSGVSLTSGTLSPVFSANNVEYNVALLCTVSETMITPVKADSAATIKVNGFTVPNITVTLAPGRTKDVIIEVTAQDGITKKTYIIHVTRAPYSANANLSAINISSGTLSPAFNASDLEYNVTLLNTVSGTTVTPVKADSTAVMKIDGTVMSNKTVTLSKGQTKDVTIEVTAQDGVTKKTYTIHITRALYSSNAKLSGISLSSGTLSPAFNANTAEYYVTLSNTVQGTTITPVKADSTATIKIGGAAVSSKTVTLSPGQKTDVIIEVTAQDGVTTNTYTVHVTRSFSNNANLSAIYLTSGTLSPIFNASIVEYNVALSSTISKTTVTPVKADSTATIKIDGAAVSSKEITPALGQTKDVNIEVTAQNGITVKTYTLHITRVPYSSNANLSGITISCGTLSPEFSANTLEYTITLPSFMIETSITPVKADNTAVVRINGTIGTNLTIVAFPPGQTENAVIEVTAQDGKTKKTYTLHITREAVMVTGVELDKTIDLKIGDSSAINCNVLPADATNKDVTWDSDNPGVATVSEGRITAVGVGSARITVRTVEGNYTDTCMVTVTTGKYNITVNSKNTYYGTVSGGGTYYNGASVTLTATPTIGYRFLWWTENNTMVSTNQSYIFTAVVNRSLTADFAALTPVGINCSETDASVFNGKDGSVAIKASGGDSGSYQYSINGGIAWQDSGNFYGLAAGTYSAAVRDAVYTSNIAAYRVTVGQPSYIGSMQPNNISSTASTGTAINIVPPAAPKGYTQQSVTYSSSNPSVAAVDARGNVTFLAGGKVTIIINTVSQTVDKKGNVKAKTTTVKKTVTVKQPVQSISLNITNTTIIRSQKVKLLPSFAPITASNKKVKWASSNPKVAAVTSSGIVTGKAPGTAMITCIAQDGSGVLTSCTVTVMPIYPTGVKLSKTALTIKPGKTFAIKATLLPSTTDFRTVIWTSSNPGIATVDAKGRIKGISSGTVTITATTSNGLSTSCTVTVQ